MLCVLPQHEIPRSFPGLKLPKLCFLFCRCLLMDLPDSSRAFRSPPLKGEKKNAEPWEKDDLRSLFDIIYYFNHTQLQTEITSQRQTEAQITF